MLCVHINMPDEVKLVLVDPKKVELSNYNGVPHLLCPVVTDPKKASIALQNIVKEMEKRYEMFADEKVKNISGYNEKMSALMKRNPEDSTIKLMSYIVVIIDELADLRRPRGCATKAERLKSLVQLHKLWIEPPR